MQTAALQLAMDVVDRCEGATSALAAGRALRDALHPLGAYGFYAGAYPVHAGADEHQIAAHHHLYAQFSPPGWQDAYRTEGLDAGNPVILAAGRTATPFRWSASGVRGTENWKGIDVARAIGMADGFAVPCHGPGGYVAIVSIGFRSFDLSPREQTAIHLAAVAVHDRMRALSPPPAPRALPVKLSPRERDCLGFVAMGLTDWDISVRLGISQTTARAHVENAKRKLGARTRPEAVARLAAAGLL